MANELINLLNAADTDVQANAHHMITLSNDPALISDFKPLAIDEMPHIQVTFCKYLQNIPVKLAFPHFLDLFSASRKDIRSQVSRLWPLLSTQKQIKSIPTLLKNDHLDIISFALGLVTRHDHKESAPSALKLTHHSDSDIRLNATQVLAKLDSRFCRKALTKYLRKGQSDTTQSLPALQSVLLSNHTRYIRQIKPYLSHLDPQVSIAAIRAYSHLKGKRSLSLFIRLLSRCRNELVGKSIITEISRYSSQKAVASLISTACSHPIFPLRNRASSALDNMEEVTVYKHFLTLLRVKKRFERGFIIRKVARHRFS
ncbi:hypothetical protein HOH87_03590 [bacterium]|jgi:hypothetical protein|nr:hypothetical protein [bacterium]